MSRLRGFEARLCRVHAWTAGLGGWRRAVLAVGAGALSTLAMAPFHAWPVLLVTLPFLIWLLDGACGAPGETRSAAGRARRAAMAGWLFGFGYFLSGLYWVGSAFLVEAEKFAWLLPAAVSLLPAGLALFYAFAAALASLIWRPGFRRVIALAIGFTIAEWLRGHLFTGFPWNSLGNALTGTEPMLQWASGFGVYGLTLVAVLLFGSPAALVGGRRDAPLPRRSWAAPAAMAAVYVVMTAIGYGRLGTALEKDIAGIRLRLMQPNIAQADKWKPANREAILRRYLKLSPQAPKGGAAGLKGVTLLIWPESAFPFLLAHQPVALEALAKLLPEGTMLATGAARAGAARPGGGRRQIFNSLYVIGSDAQITSTYDKYRLVPFGEFLPFQSVLEAVGLEQLTRIRGGFSRGAGPQLLRAPGLPPFLPLICYEIIFSGGVTGDGERPGWLLNVTNDAWFGDSTGPYQHLHQARVRAVEEGLPVVRVANSGMSAVIGPYGRLRSRLPLNTHGLIDSPLPAALPATLFARFGSWILLIGLSLSLAIVIWPWRPNGWRD